MLLFRIAKKEHIRDLSGIGARLYGGRWNHKGVSVIYTSETRALSTLEYLVHVDFTNYPTDLAIASLKVPDGVIPAEIAPSALPTDWRNFPPPETLADIGTQWARSRQSLMLRVPSAVVDSEFNILINAAHPDIRLIDIINIDDYSFDPRLLPEMVN
jgi:RES domain-containing protein